MKESKDVKAACMEERCILDYHGEKVTGIVLKKRPTALNRQELRYWENFIYHCLGGIWAGKTQKTIVPCLFLSGRGNIIFGGLIRSTTHELIVYHPLRERREKGFEELMDFFKIRIDNY